MITKQLEIKEYKEVDDEVIEILASDESVDRDRDVIKLDGWDVTNWLKTGSLIYGHDPSSPFNVVGSAYDAKIKDNGLYLYSKLAKKGTSEPHDAIRSLIEQKILKGVSVGFIASDYEPREGGGRTFTKQELLEVSLTPVPSNANAKVLMKNFSKETQEALLVKEEDWKEKYENLQKDYEEMKDKYNSLTESYSLLAKSFFTDQEETQDVEPEEEEKTFASREMLIQILSKIKKQEI